MRGRSGTDRSPTVARAGSLLAGLTPLLAAALEGHAGSERLIARAARLLAADNRR
jgi:hypothetical protein